MNEIRIDTKDTLQTDIKYTQGIELLMGQKKKSLACEVFCNKAF